MAQNIFCAVARKPRRNLLCLDQEEISNVRAIISVDADVVIPDSFETKTAFLAWLLPLIFTCKAYIIQNIMGSKPRAGAVTTGRNYAGRTRPKVVSKDHTITGFDPSYLDNIEWWNQLEEDATDQNLIYITKDRAWPVRDQELSVEHGTVIAEDGRTQIDGQFDIFWNQKGEVIPMYIPGIAAAVNNAIVLTVTAGNSPTGFTASAGNVFTVGNGVAASVDFNVTEPTAEPLTWKMLESAIPGLTVNATTGALAGTPSSVGTYNRTIQAETPCGVVGLIKIRVVVS